MSNKDRKIIDIICAIAFVVGFVLTVTDGCKNFLALHRAFSISQTSYTSVL